MYEITVHVGGSNRQLKRTRDAFKAAGIPLAVCGYTGSGHYSNQVAFMPDTQKARELLHRMKGTVAKKQLSDERQP